MEECYLKFTKSDTPPWCCSRLLNCTNGTKSRNASHIENVRIEIFKNIYHSNEFVFLQLFQLFYSLPMESRLQLLLDCIYHEFFIISSLQVNQILYDKNTKEFRRVLRILLSIANGVMVVKNGKLVRTTNANHVSINTISKSYRHTSNHRLRIPSAETQDNGNIKPPSQNINARKNTSLNSYSSDFNNNATDGGLKMYLNQSSINSPVITNLSSTLSDELQRTQFQRTNRSFVEEGDVAKCDIPMNIKNRKTPPPVKPKPNNPRNKGHQKIVENCVNQDICLSQTNLSKQVLIARLAEPYAEENVNNSDRVDNNLNKVNAIKTAKRQKSVKHSTNKEQLGLGESRKQSTEDSKSHYKPPKWSNILQEELQSRADSNASDLKDALNVTEVFSRYEKDVIYSRNLNSSWGSYISNTTCVSKYDQEVAAVFENSNEEDFIFEEDYNPTPSFTQEESFHSLKSTVDIKGSGQEIDKVKTEVSSVNLSTPKQKWLEITQMIKKQSKAPSGLIGDTRITY